MAEQNRRRSAALATTFALLTAGASVRGDVTARGPALAGDDIATLFSVRKSENRNRVDYGLRMRADCRADGSAPVFVYWRMLEEGPRATTVLRRIEHRAYGIASQRVSTDGTRVDLALRALPGRPLTVRTRQTPGGCSAETTTRIAGAIAQLTDVYVVLSGPLSIDHLELRGRNASTRAAVFERVDP